MASKGWVALYPWMPQSMWSIYLENHTLFIQFSESLALQESPFSAAESAICYAVPDSDYGH
jgi:hypothetical protein